jgi:hypothetical protein
MEKSEFIQAFDTVADIYDQWYDSPSGKAVFNAEKLCLKRLGGSFTLEIHFLFLMNEFREGTYTPQGGTKQSPPQGRD